jgi:hypothetical protein
MLTPEEIARQYREIYLRVQRSFGRKYKGIFDKVSEDFARLANDPNMKFAKAYKFPPSIEMKMTAIMADFQERSLLLVEQGIEDAWDISRQKNDKIVTSYLRTIETIKAAQQAAYFMPNIPALKAFILREGSAEKLSDVIWKVSKQFRAELETHLGIGITNGDSAQVISQRIRQYLNNPDVLFRRVRDKKGKLIASKAMQDYHPGQGVYKSAYKNAMRVTRSETNHAYLLADHLRWSQLDMVIGVRISLSAQHPDYNFPEICEVLEGDYPKEFLFVGWHPHCLCHEVPILMPQDDFKAYLKGNEPLKAKQITEYSDAFRDFVKGNYERFSGYKSVPYWLTDNKDIIKGLL